MRLLIYPGAHSPRLTLQELRREPHEAARERRAREIAERQEKGVPLDDHTDWSQVDEAATALRTAVEARDTRSAIEAVRALDVALSRKALTPIEAYKPEPIRDEVRLVIRALEHEARQQLLLAVEDAAAAVDAAVEAGADKARIVELDADFRRQVRGFLLASLVSMTVGDDVVDTVGENDIAALEGAGLLFDVYAGVRDYQGLSEGKAGRFGRPPPST